MRKKGVLLIVSGPAGSGKGTVVRFLREDPSFAFSVSATTRAPRAEDAEGVTYFFKSKEEFASMVERGELLEHASYVGNDYGTPRAPVEKALEEGKTVILEIETEGARQVKAAMPEAVSVMLLPPDAPTLAARLRGRGTEDEPTVRKRLKKALSEVEAARGYDYVVVNEDGRARETADEVRAIVLAEKARAAGMAGFLDAFIKSAENEK